MPLGQAGVAGQCGSDVTTAPTTDEGTTTTTTADDTESTSVTTTIDPDTATTTISDTDTTTGPPPSCDEPDGTFGETCTGNTPFCVGGECMRCSSDDPLTTCGGSLVCAPNGACVECTTEEDGACTVDSPYCDPITNTCMPCSEHEHCGPAACNLFTGACVGGMVVTAGAGQQYPTLAAAVAAVNAGGGGTIIVATGSYDEEVIIGGGAIIAFLADEGAAVTWQRTQGVGAPQLRVTGGATVLMDEMDLRNNDSAVDPALRVDGASLWVDRGVIAQNDGIAVRTEASAEVVLRNCFIGGEVDLPALNNTMGSSMTIRYSTIGGGTGNSNGILCDAGSDVTVSDSIILTRGGLPEVDCAMLTAEHTAANTVLVGTDNIEVMGTMTGWFTSYNTGDFHLSVSGQPVFQGVAQWNDGDPLVDIDGMARSGADGTPEYAGADFIP
ncbi:hypothetical protein OEB96_05275 [Paraliomyxa miuraensis]|nr:hypothetical protein [Paraliomyxa miuraensis]